MSTSARDMIEGAFPEPPAGFGRGSEAAIERLETMRDRAGWTGPELMEVLRERAEAARLAAETRAWEAQPQAQAPEPEAHGAGSAGPWLAALALALAWVALVGLLAWAVAGVRGPGRGLAAVVAAGGLAWGLGRCGR